MGVTGTIILYTCTLSTLILNGEYVSNVPLAVCNAMRCMWPCTSTSCMYCALCQNGHFMIYSLQLIHVCSATLIHVCVCV